MLIKKMTKPVLHREIFLNHKKFKESIKIKAEFENKKVELERDRLAGLVDKVSFDLKRLPVPLPVDFETFEKGLLIQSESKEDKSQKKGNGFGVGSRMPLSDKEKWGIKVARWNEKCEKQMDPKLDNQPGPLAYSLIAHWKGKINKKKKNADEQEKLPNIFKCVSRGPNISQYYAQI